MPERSGIVGSLVLIPITAILGVLATAASPQPSNTLRYFEGSWHCDGAFPSNGRKISSRLVFTWFPKTGGVLKQHDDEAPNSYHAVELWVASSDGRLRDMIGDSFGGVRSFSSIGWDRDSLSWISDSALDERFVYTKLGANTMRIDWWVSKNGAPLLIGDTLTCLRAGH